MRISTTLFHQRGLGGILDQQSSLVNLQAKIASGRRITSPSDDPSGSVQALRLTQTKAVIEQYMRNSDMALNRLQLEEVTIQGVEDKLLRVRELAIQASNSILGNQDRSAIAIELREHLQALRGLANTQDSNQEYLFAGNQVTQKPFSELPDGTTVYNGDQGERSIQISSGQRLKDGDSGHSVFMDILNGNGTFEVQAALGNSGSGIIDPGQVFDTTAYVADDYTISFVTNAAGNLAYNVVGVNSGQLIPPLPANPVLNAPDYLDGAAIRFNGIETKIEADPVDGDTFTLIPSSKQDLFTTVDKLASALEIPVYDSTQRSQAHNIISSSIVDLDRAFDKVTNIRTGIGSRLRTIEDRSATNESFLLEITSTLSDIQDLDIVSAAGELQRRLTALEAAQSAYVRIQGLTLFNFIR